MPRPKTGGKQKGYKAPATLAKEEAKEALRKLLTAQMQPIADALISRCKGVRYFVTRNQKTGKYELVTDPEKVVAALNQEDEMTGEFYTDKPETAAIKEAFERMVGQSDKPAEEVKHSVGITVKWEAE